jgi:hypothetical protein
MVLAAGAAAGAAAAAVDKTMVYMGLEKATCTNWVREAAQT